MRDRIRLLVDAISNDVENSLPSVDDRTGFALRRLVERCSKKFSSSSTMATARTAIESFIDTNATMAMYTLDVDRRILAEAREFIYRAFCNFTNRSFDIPDYPYVKADLLNRWRFGPGASNGVKGTHTAVKIGQSMTCTTYAVQDVLQLRKSNPYMSCFDADHSGIAVVPGSRLSTVPKNEVTDRVIAIEPSGNMAMQLALGSYVEDVLAFMGLDIKTQQPKNKFLASVGVERSLATIDLARASDTISLPLCRELLPKAVYYDMLRFRSEYAEIDGQQHRLNMMSTMGNGFTFPLMTLIFVSLVYANRRLHFGGPRNFIDWRNTAVFGDDIIVPSAEALSLYEVLESAGFSVNTQKSYVDGPFRESCGGDFYEGFNVTPFYIRDLSSDPAINVVINQLLTFSSRLLVPFPQSLRLLVGWLKRVLFVPEWHGDTDGVRCSQVTGRYKHYSIEQKRVRLKDSVFAMPLACGGFLTPGADDLFYIPRPFKTRYKIRRSRLPEGFLDGWCAERRSAGESDFVNLQLGFISEFSA